MDTARGIREFVSRRNRWIGPGRLPGGAQGREPEAIQGLGGVEADALAYPVKWQFIDVKGSVLDRAAIGVTS